MKNELTREELLEIIQPIMTENTTQESIEKFIDLYIGKYEELNQSEDAE